MTKIHEFRNSTCSIGCYRFDKSRQSVVRAFSSVPYESEPTQAILHDLLFERGEITANCQVSPSNSPNGIQIQRVFRSHKEALGFTFRQAVRFGLTKGVKK